MSINYGYYLPLSTDLFGSVRFLDISPKGDGPGSDGKQKVDRDGVPQWVVSALVKVRESKTETETFTLTAPLELAERIDKIEELTPIRLVGLSGGKWSRATSDKTEWSFQITGVEIVK